MPADIAVEPAERDEVDVDGVEHQLDAEQNADGVAPRDDAEQADRENDRGENQVRVRPIVIPPASRNSWRQQRHEQQDRQQFKGSSVLRQSPRSRCPRQIPVHQTGFTHR
jgi:hypothetical protein